MGGQRQGKALWGFPQAPFSGCHERPKEAILVSTEMLAVYTQYLHYPACEDEKGNREGVRREKRI